MISKIMVQFCYLGIETLSCCLLQQMARMEAESLKLEKVGPTFSSFNAVPSKLTKK